MPYPFAHPAAVLPLCGRMGGLGVPSALVIGSIAPDLWYLLPGLDRSDSHTAAGLFLFCLPAGLLVYACYHLLLKQPLVALLPRSVATRVVAYAQNGWPCAPWRPAVLASLLAGTLTHLVWDVLTHWYSFNDVQVLQHASTLLGTAYIAWWLHRRLQRLPAKALPENLLLSPSSRAWILTLLSAAAASAGSIALAGDSAGLSADHAVLRELARTAAHAALPALGCALLAYCLLWRLRGLRRFAARPD